MTPIAESLNEVMAAVEKRCGPATIGRMGRAPAIPTESLSTGSLALDLATGIDGYPVGRVIEIFGPECSGKTTLGLHAIAEVQKTGGTCAFIDTEHTLDLAYARGIGVDPERALISQPDTAEAALEIIEVLARSGRVALVVIDSVAWLMPKDEVDLPEGGQPDGLQARRLAKALRMLTCIAERTGTTLLFLNPLRRTDYTFGPSFRTAGGNVLRFYASMRIELRRIGDVRRGHELVGAEIQAKVVKNKYSSPFAVADFEIRWGEGIDRLGELVDLGVRFGVLQTAGRQHLSKEGVPLGHGRNGAREAFGAVASLQAEVRDAIVAAARERGGCP